MVEVRLAQFAMGTRFELLLLGEKKAYLNAVGEDVLREIGERDRQLSFYRDDSDISDINARAAYEPVFVEPRLFGLLETAQRIYRATGGAFDITVAPLMQCWGFVGSTGQMPEPEAVEAARARVGMNHVVLNRKNFTVRFDREGVLLDLGAIGKGYAIAEAVQTLRDYEITCALLHGGTSSIAALGAPPGQDGWKIALQRPFAPEDAPPVAYCTLCDTTLSVSAPHNKWFQSEGKRYGHIIDPRTGYPATTNLLAALILDSAMEGDAFSTALLTLGPAFLPALAALRPDMQAIVGGETETGDIQLVTHGTGWRLETSL